MQLAVRRLACLYFVYKSLVHSVQAGAGAECGCSRGVYGICGGPAGGRRSACLAVRSAGSSAPRPPPQIDGRGERRLGAGRRPTAPNYGNIDVPGRRTGGVVSQAGRAWRQEAGRPRGAWRQGVGTTRGEAGRPRGDVARTSDSPHGRQGQSSVLSGKIGHWPSGGSSYQLRK